MIKLFKYTQVVTAHSVNGKFTTTRNKSPFSEHSSAGIYKLTHSDNQKLCIGQSWMSLEVGKKNV